MKKILFVLLIISTLILAGCDFTGEDGEQISPEQLQTYVAETVSAALSLTPQASDTPVPTATFTNTPTATETATPLPTNTNTPIPNTGNTSGQPKGCDDALFVSDVTVPDGTQFAPGATFTKTWKLQNSGSCAWTTAYSVYFVSGDGMGGTSPQLLTAQIEPGFSHDISLNLTAPTAPGTYRSTWQLKNAAGQAFGHSFYVEIVVTGGNTTPTATATGPTPTPSATSAGGTGKPDLKVYSLSFNPVPERGVESTITIVIENSGDVDATNFLVEWWSDQSNEDPASKKTWNIGTLAANSTKELIHSCDCWGSSGTYTTRVLVDATGTVDESDEGNNNYTSQVSVK